MNLIYEFILILLYYFKFITRLIIIKEFKILIKSLNVIKAYKDIFFNFFILLIKINFFKFYKL